MEVVLFEVSRSPNCGEGSIIDVKLLVERLRNLFKEFELLPVEVSVKTFVLLTGDVAGYSPQSDKRLIYMKPAYFQLYCYSLNPSYICTSNIIVCI